MSIIRKDETALYDRCPGRFWLPRSVLFNLVGKQIWTETRGVEEQIDPAVQSPTPKGNKKTRKPRKISHLSEEFVRDDSDTAPDENKQSKANIEPEKTQSLVPATPAQVIPKKGRGRPRKSDQGSVPKDKKQKPTLANRGASLERENETPPEKRTHKEPDNRLRSIPQSDGTNTVPRAIDSSSYLCLGHFLA